MKRHLLQKHNGKQCSSTETSSAEITTSRDDWQSTASDTTKYYLIPWPVGVMYYATLYPRDIENQDLGSNWEQLDASIVDIVLPPLPGTGSSHLSQEEW